MKNFKLFGSLILASVTLMGTGANLSVSCGDGVGYNGNCAVGRVTFTSPNYSGTVHINVLKNSNNAEYDDFDYDASGGQLSFTESLIPGGTYTITITANGNTYTQSVTTGSTWHRDDD